MASITCAAIVSLFSGTIKSLAKYLAVLTYSSNKMSGEIPIPAVFNIKRIFLNLAITSKDSQVKTFDYGPIHIIPFTPKIIIISYF